MDKPLSDLKKTENRVKQSGYMLLVISLLALVSSVMEHKFLTDYKQGEYLHEYVAATASSVNSSREGFIAIINLVTYIIFAISFFIWIYQSTKNQTALGIKEQAFTPKWAVAWFFIPIAHLWMGYRVIKELWMSEKTMEKNDIILPLWWTIKIINGLAGNIYALHSLRAQTITELIEVNNIGFISILLTIIDTLFIIKIVSKITEFQTERNRELTEERELNPI